MSRPASLSRQNDPLALNTVTDPCHTAGGIIGCQLVVAQCETTKTVLTLSDPRAGPFCPTLKSKLIANL